VSGAVGGQSDEDVTSTDVHRHHSSEEADNNMSTVLYTSSTVRTVEATVESVDTATRSPRTVVSVQSTSDAGASNTSTLPPQPVDPSEIPVRYYLLLLSLFYSYTWYIQTKIHTQI